MTVALEPPTTRDIYWAEIGTQFETPPSSVNEALDLAGLDFEVGLFPMGDWNETEEDWVAIPNRRSVRRLDTGAYLGNVSPRYHPLQNRDAFGFADAIIDAGKGYIVAAWGRNKGAKVGLALELEQVTVLDETVTPHMVCLTSHNGKDSVQVHIVIVQLACYNILPSVSRKATRSWSARHSSYIEQQMEQALSALDMADDYTAQAIVEMERLGKIFVAEPKGQTICRRALRKSMPRMSTKRVDETTEDIMGVWNTTDTLVDKYRPTAWGLMHAVTEYWDYYRQYRTANARANSIGSPSGIGKRCRERVYSLLTTPETA